MYVRMDICVHMRERDSFLGKIQALKTAHAFAGSRALLTKHVTKKRLCSIWLIWYSAYLLY
jgi:hypothetical protein